MKKLYSFVIFVITLLNSSLGFSQLFNQDFSISTTVATYVSATPSNGQFNAIGTSGAGTVLSINTSPTNQLRFARTANAGSYSRTTDFSPTPSSLVYKFDLTVSGNSVAQTTAAVFQVGSGFGTANSAEANAAVHSRIGVNWTTTAGQFSLRDLVASTNSANFSGVKTVTWYINNSGASINYTAPDASIYSVGDDKCDVWIGTTQVFDEIAATTTTQVLTDLKFAFTAGTGTIDIDNINIDPIVPSGNSIAAPTFSTPICLSSGGATLPVSFTSTGTFTGNTYNVELSSAAGSFASPTVIGTTVSNANTITNLSCTIPYGLAGGTGYLMRVTANGPATTGTSSAAFTISTNSVSPLTTQNITTGVSGTTLNVSGYTASTILWKYGTTSGGPYSSSLGAGTGQAPNFPFVGTYYMVCTNNYATCGLVTSDETQINVTLLPVTSPTVTNACITDETVNWTLPAGYSTSNNTILVFAKASSAVTVGTPTNAASSYTSSTTFGSGTPYQNDASAFCIYNGTSNTVNLLGLTSGVTYHFLILNVQNSPTVYATGATANGTTLSTQPDVTGLTATTSNGEIDLSWTNPACYDEILIVTTNTGAVSSVPTGDGTQYFDNPIYGDALSNANLAANEFDVFQGTNPSTTISGLLNGQIYYIKVFVRKGTNWSSGVAINATPNFALNHFQSATSGNWNDYLTWNVWNGTAFVPATSGQFPNSNNYDVTILSGHTITYNFSGYSVRTLQVDAGGKLYTNQSQNLTLKYIAIYSSIVCNGTIGDGTNNDGIAFRIEGATCTISGSGTFYCARIKKEVNPTVVTNLTISRNVNLTWSATALLNDCSAPSTFNVTISAGATVSTRTDKGNVSIDGTNGADTSPLRGTITVFGTLNVNGKLYLTTNNISGNPVNFTIRAGGVVNVDTVIASASGAGTHNLLIYNNGLLNVYGSAGFFSFSPTNNTYTCNAGAIGATIEYSGSAQPVESAIIYTNLKYSGSGNKTANGNLTVNGNFIVDAAIAEFNTPVKTLNLGGNLTLQNGGTMSDNCKDWLNITTSSATTAQTFTGNSQLIKCLTLTSVKTAGSLSLATNTGCYFKNDLRINFSGAAALTDNGNTISVGDDAELGGASSNFNLTGTLKFVCIGGSTDIHLSDFGTGVTLAHLKNLEIDPELTSPISTVQFYPAGGGQTVYIDGNLNISNSNSLGSVLNPNNNTISIKGNWNNYDATGFTEAAGQVIFVGTVAQTINAIETFNKLEINNATGVTITNLTYVSTELKLTNGTLNTGLFQEIDVTSSAVGSVSGYSTSSWVNGNLRRTVAATGIYDFPVGNANYQLATVNLTSQTGMSSILAFFNTVITGTAPSYPATSINGDGINGILNSGFWTITPNAYSAVNYDVTLNQRGYSNFAGNASQLGVIKRANSGATWAGTNLSGSNGFHNNATQTIGGGTATAKRSGVTSFSDFAVGFGGVSLPVTLSSFTLYVKENKRVELNWKTESEVDCNYFSIERSQDGKNFYSIGKVEGHATSDQPHSYELVDYKPFCSTSYYRLQQVDFNNEEHFSNILSAEVSCSGITMNPNLVLDKISIKFLTEISGPVNLSITNIEGKKFIERTVSFPGTELLLDVSELAAGMYLIQLSSGEMSYNNRFFKQ